MAAPELHPATASLLRWFDYEHLPETIARNVSAEFHRLAHELVEFYGLEGPELTTGLRKLLEAKDCLVRAALDARAPAPAKVDGL